MLNRSVSAGASTSQKAKWRFDRETKEWVCDTPPAPKAVKVVAPVAPVAPAVKAIAPVAPVAPAVKAVAPAPAAVPAPVAPVAAVPPVAPLAFSTSQNGPGLAYVAPAVFNLQVATPVAKAPARAAKPKRSARDLLHPDVVLPLVAALIVLILLLAWAA